MIPYFPLSVKRRNVSEYENFSFETGLTGRLFYDIMKEIKTFPMGNVSMEQEETDMKLKIDYTRITGVIKPMNAVNNGPVHKRTSSQNAGNLIPYTEAHIPFARTHDAAFFATYGGEHTVDVMNIFPDFDADPCDSASYDFHLTDEYLETIEMAGTEPFYRLGHKIEHASKKYGTLPPKDFTKWAIICEHIIAHINEGWANGHHMNVRYWEIWNEPDLDPDDAADKRCWGGTAAEFRDLYAIASKHLKSRFPHLKIGGPAVAGFREKWDRDFLARARDEKLPLDFFSWHCYAHDLSHPASMVKRFRDLLDEYGFYETESILNEWNYVNGWSGEGFVKSVETIIGTKGSAYIASVMAMCQKLPVDMLMYYDARPTVFNGLFSFYTKKPIKGYYAVKAWGDMLTMGKECETVCDVPGIQAVSASDGNGGCMTLVSCFTDLDDQPAKTFTVEMNGKGSDELTVYLLDDTHDLTAAQKIFAADGKFSLTLEPNTFVVLR